MGGGRNLLLLKYSHAINSINSGTLNWVVDAHIHMFVIPASYHTWPLKLYAHGIKLFTQVLNFSGLSSLLFSSALRWLTDLSLCPVIILRIFLLSPSFFFSNGVHIILLFWWPAGSLLSPTFYLHFLHAWKSLCIYIW